MRAAQHSASRATVRRIGHRTTLRPFVASMAFPPTELSYRLAPHPFKLFNPTGCNGSPAPVAA
jgi:hypothetical protein